MMNIKDLTYAQLCSYINKTFEFTSDCEFFPNFNVIGKITKVDINNKEYIISVSTKPTGKLIKIGSNMKNLKMKVINHQ